METEKSLSRYILVGLSVSVVLTALVIVALNAYVTNRRLSGDGETFIGSALSSFSYNKGYKDGYEAARAKYSITPVEITQLNGTLIEIKDQKLTVQAENLDTDEFIDGVSNLRTVMISTSTKILSRTPISTEELDKRLAAWRRSGQQDTTPPPSAYDDEEIDFEDLNAGQMVAITAGEDIRLASSFTATEIIVLSEPAQ